MEQRMAENMKERTRRPIRNKRYNRRVFGEEKRPQKRLFTPEIKRFLKDWLVRRRDNPYPNRDEKKSLAVQTGLTYIQVCNWFANWRRKLKNAGREPQRKTWGHLIKTYNNQVQGNVEHFSICSDDSIWEEGDSPPDPGSNGGDYSIDHSYTVRENHIKKLSEPIYSSSTPIGGETEPNPFAQHKYKNHIMEKYLRDCQKPDCDLEEEAKPSMISKWLESAVNFRPSENNYLHWTLSKPAKKKLKKTPNGGGNASFGQQHGREELDAAEALTRLANAHAALKSEVC